MERSDKGNSRNICRAMIMPVTENEDYDFEAVAVPSKNGQVRYSWENDEYFNQVLGTGNEHIEQERLDSGLPMFDNHPYDTSARNLLGITGSYFFDERGLVIRGKLGARADEALRSDIKNGILKTVSIEGDIISYTITRNPNQMPVYFAEKWIPTSISFAPIPNDIGAQMEAKRAYEMKKEKTKDSFIKSLINKF